MWYCDIKPGNGWSPHRKESVVALRMAMITSLNADVTIDKLQAKCAHNIYNSRVKVEYL